MHDMWQTLIYGQVCGAIMPLLITAFGYLRLAAVVASGFVMMFAPPKAKEILKNAAISLALFVLGVMLLQSFCALLRRGGP